MVQLCMEENIGQMAAATSAAHLHPMVQIFDDAEA